MDPGLTCRRRPPAADTVTSTMRVHHLTNLALAGLVPAAYFTPPDMPAVQRPVDLALGVALPVHAHITTNMIVSDYIPPAARGVVRTGVLGATVVALAGLAKLNLAGPGLTPTLRQFWAKKE